MTKPQISLETTRLIREQLEALSTRIPLKVWMVTMLVATSGRWSTPTIAATRLKKATSFPGKIRFAAA